MSTVIYRTKHEVTAAVTVITHEPRGGWSDNCNELLKTPAKHKNIVIRGATTFSKLGVQSLV